MTASARAAVAPLYLLLCLVLGGSAQGIWGNMLLELVGTAIIVWAVAAPSPEASPNGAQQLIWIAAAALALILFQMIPLPASIWPGLGGRRAIAEGYQILGLTIPVRPLSLTPHEGWSALVEVIPPVALFLAVVRLHAYRPAWVSLALIAGTTAAILLGALQSTSAEPQTSPFYLYRDSSFGVATGFFANANHMAMLLLVTIPFLAAIVASARGVNVQRFSALLALGSGALIAIVVGILLNKSIAAYVLVVPVVLASALVVAAVRKRVAFIGAIVAGVAAAGAIAFMAFSPVGNETLGASTSLSSRSTIAQTTVEAAQDFMPFGSGLGSFRGVYRLYEDHDRIERIQVNHAHNEYLEIALELGIGGVILLLAFLAWWSRSSWRAWRIDRGDPYARAAVIASAVLLAHSAVEFPLRSIALSAVFGLCLALIVARRRVEGADKSQLWPTRHVVLD